MIVWLSMCVISIITTFYVGKKGWHALHKVVGISPGALIYQHPNAPLSVTDMTWQQLILNQQHLTVLSDEQLRQLQRIDNKVTAYHSYQQGLCDQNMATEHTEGHFVLQKWLATRLPEMLASHYHAQPRTCSQNTKVSLIYTDNTQHVTANQLLQQGLDNIEQRSDRFLEEIERRHLQELQVMQRYMNEHNHD
ncbi:hypothetical protein [Psychrobacter sp. 16-MNA-CIBAN-0192]|uniref:hypothetical protein n=1 Tax=Psychrobacter sp. 16-MNA-CIBAN-0192 TaxID=3140448 RepID=UPI00332945A5